MVKNKSYWWLLLILVVLSLLLPLLILLPEKSESSISPWTSVSQRMPHTDHTAIIQGLFTDGPSVTQVCLKCHEKAAEEVLHTSHFTWETPPKQLPGHNQPVKLGKKNALNNFCIGIRSNWPPCTACHAGYGWFDETYDFSIRENVDCLVCHDRSGSYVKTNGGLPASDIDLLTVARSVGSPTRENCGSCHFRGGGGNAVKHGDLDESLYYPSEFVDVHMGKHDFTCIDCHRTQQHRIKGKAISVSFGDHDQVYCTDCHQEQLHRDERINRHTTRVACQTCHIPKAAVKEATKMHWDWSAAGKDLPEDTHHYIKKKGSFKYEKEIVPEYAWYNGLADHYILGDSIDLNNPTAINRPLGDIKDKKAKIWPFKIHRAKQIYDKKYSYLLQPKTYGKGGFWSDFDWHQAATLGSQAVNLPYSGHYDFTETEMYWPITHMVAPKNQTLQCIDCHNNDQKRLNWISLGYSGDPSLWGGSSRR